MEPMVSHLGRLVRIAMLCGTPLCLRTKVIGVSMSNVRLGLTRQGSLKVLERVLFPYFSADLGPSEHY